MIFRKISFTCETNQKPGLVVQTMVILLVEHLMTLKKFSEITDVDEDLIKKIKSHFNLPVL